jgi:excisionase family DNA binding protein
MSQFSLPTLLRPREVAELLGTSEQTLANWRSTQRYDLPFVKAGGVVRYDAADVARFIESHRSTPTR